MIVRAGATPAAGAGRQRAAQERRALPGRAGRLCAALALLSLLSAGRPDPFAEAQERFPPLQPYAPAPPAGALARFVAAGTSWVRLGGSCRQLVPRAKGGLADVGLCKGNVAGHYFRRFVTLRLGAELELSQPLLEHGLDRRGDARQFPAEKPEWTAFVPVAVDSTHLSLGEELYELSTQCWASSNTEGVCPDGSRHPCNVCQELRLLGGKERASHVYASLKIVANLGAACDAPCADGMPMNEADALGKLLTGKRFAWKGAASWAIHRTKAACLAATDPDPLPEPPSCEEPELPPRR